MRERERKRRNAINNELTRTGETIESFGCEQSNLIAIMQEIQAEYKYLSEEALTLVAEKLGISTAKVYNVATFYENFSLEAKGKYIIKVCAGTGCHGFCEMGPLVHIGPMGIMYIHVKPEDCHEILDRIIANKGTLEDMDMLQELPCAAWARAPASLCRAP